ncbi:hypothetical protein AMTRI_Chr03g147470 [Amborella trichopoda]
MGTINGSCNCLQICQLLSLPVALTLLSLRHFTSLSPPRQLFSLPVTLTLLSLRSAITHFTTLSCQLLSLPITLTLLSLRSAITSLHTRGNGVLERISDFSGLKSISRWSIGSNFQELLKIFDISETQFHDHI